MSRDLINIKRIYDKRSASNGFSILVDRLWPRAISKLESKVDLWIKEIASSNSPRKWFNHDPNKWEERGYYKELDSKGPEVIEKA